jgi:glycosyltransferase involved in cell wall biosynthesis
LSKAIVCVIPALNACSTVETVATSVRRAVPGIFLIGVDDGSTDYTRLALRRVCDRTIEFDFNRGKGAALRAAFALIQSMETEAILTIDADGQHDPTFAPKLLTELGCADVVIGVRQINTTTVPSHRRIANWLSTAAIRAVTKWPMRDSQSGFRAIQASVLSRVQPLGNRYEFETDFLVRASYAGCRIAEVTIPTIYGPPSHFREISDSWRVARTLWSHRAAVFR